MKVVIIGRYANHSQRTLSAHDSLESAQRAHRKNLKRIHQERMLNAHRPEWPMGNVLISSHIVSEVRYAGS